jgi:hypothetical protein
MKKKNDGKRIIGYFGIKRIPIYEGDRVEDNKLYQDDKVFEYIDRYTIKIRKIEKGGDE